MIDIAVIGCGHWGPHHIRTFNSLADARVVAAIDPDERRLNRIGELFPEISRGTEDQMAGALEAADAVVIATPTATHYELVKKALLANKHVLCEKPLCQTAEQARELVQLAESKGRILMVGHVFLFNGGVIKLKELVDTGELGEIRYLSATRTNLGPIRSDVNVAYDLASHDISIFNWLLGGPPESVSATGGVFLQPGIQDVAFISLCYKNGCMANIHASWLNPKKVRQLTLVGSKKMLTWDDLRLKTPVAIYESGAQAIPEHRAYGEYLRISMWDSEVRLPKVSLEEPLRVQDRHFLQAIQSGSLDRSDGPFSTDVVSVLEAVATSLENNGASAPVHGK
ncbi:Gfo/Idh/MocA family oxidoreductase [bacterium AH-315-F18]|nr:Gfo/Idh/MocA family oxidoreductase [bacterium AH-315-F18]